MNSRKLAREEKDADYVAFWNDVYDGGKKEVTNPNTSPGSQKKIKASTALKYEPFRKQVAKDYENWKNKKNRIQLKRNGL